MYEAAKDDSRARSLSYPLNSDGRSIIDDFSAPARAYYERRAVANFSLVLLLFSVLALARRLRMQMRFFRRRF